MMSKIQVSIEEVKQLKARIKEINLLNFDDIEWTENGSPLIIDKRCINDWAEIGLNNVDFIACNFYINKFG